MRPTVNLNDKRDLLHNPLYSPHDLSHQQEVRDDLPTLLGDVKAKPTLDRVKIIKVKLGIFNKMQNGHKAIDMKFISPFDRYKLMIPFMEAQRKREIAQEEERRRQLLEEKKKQLPSLEIVKIDNDDVVEMSLNEAKRKRSDTSVAPSPNKRWKKKKDDDGSLQATSSAENQISVMSEAIEAELKNVADMVDQMKKNNKQFKKGKPQKASDFRQSSTKPVNFDYSNVNYDRFQGGSGPSNANTSGKFQQKFKGGKKAKGNLDKMFSFSNFRLNKK